jgi:hypothetical protein
METYMRWPKGSGKFFTVGDFLEMAEDLKRREVPHESLVIIGGRIGWSNEVRQLGVKTKKE